MTKLFKCTRNGEVTIARLSNEVLPHGLISWDFIDEKGERLKDTSYMCLNLLEIKDFDEAWEFVINALLETHDEVEAIK